MPCTYDFVIADIFEMSAIFFLLDSTDLTI